MKRTVNKKHLAFLHELECPVYNAFPVVAHHLLRGDPTRGMGRKAGDNFAIPLSDRAHRELHACGDEVRYLAKFGIDGPKLASDLYRVSGDIVAGMEIINAIRQARILRNNGQKDVPETGPKGQEDDQQGHQERESPNDGPRRRPPDALD